MVRLMRVTALFVVILAVFSVVVAKPAEEKDSRKGSNDAGKEATMFTAPEGWLRSLPVGGVRAAAKPKSKALADAGYSWFNNVGVNTNVTLNGTAGSTAISVYASDIDWSYAFGSSPRIESPAGEGGTAGGGWQFPNAHRFGIVIFQGNNYWNVESTDPNNPTRITGLSNTTNIVATVNDTNGNYGDNWGSFDLYVRKDN